MAQTRRDRLWILLLGLTPVSEVSLVMRDHKTAHTGLEIDHERLHTIRGCDHLLRVTRLDRPVPQADHGKKQNGEDDCETGPDDDRGESDAREQPAVRAELSGTTCCARPPVGHRAIPGTLTHRRPASTSSTAAVISSGSKGFTMTMSAPPRKASSLVEGCAVRTITGVSASSPSPRISLRTSRPLRRGIIMSRMTTS